MIQPIIFVLLLLVALPVRADRSIWLFTYFTDNGQDGLHLAWSEDGLNWQALNGGQSYLRPEIGTKEKLVRDPCVTLGPDGTYHLVWTTGWHESSIGYAATRDFIHWSEQRELPVMAHEPTVRNAWAPEINYDPGLKQFVIFWSSTIPDRFPETAGSSESAYNHRLYATTTTDFTTFTSTTLFYDPGFSVIDATFLQAGGQLCLIVKDETVNPPRKNLRFARADSYTGPFHDLSPPFTPAGVWVEGPTAIRIGGYYQVYFDAYKDAHYGALRSRDLKTWEDVTSQLVMPGEGTPDRMRHGTVIAVPRSLIDQLRQTTPTRHVP